jgi:hypothetical protein
MQDNSFLARTLHRRSFFRVAGAATSALLLAGCSKDDDPQPAAGSSTLVLARSGENAANNTILNYAYLLEQLEAAFYDKVVATPPADLQPGELALLTDLRDHELIHREYLKYSLGSAAYDVSLPTPLEFNFSSFTLTTRAGVWAAARQLEEIGVAAYNGAAKYVVDTANTTLLLSLAKIASVEARHAALVREVLEPGSFAAPVNATGLDEAKTIVEVIALIQPFVSVEISTASLPTT